MSFVELTFEKGFRKSHEMKGYIKVSKDGTVSQIRDLPAGIEPTIDFSKIYNIAQIQFEKAIKSISPTCNSIYSSIVLKVYPYTNLIDIVLITEDEIAYKPKFFEEFEYLGASTIHRIEFSEEINYFFNLLEHLDEKEEIYSLRGLPTTDIIVTENIASAGLVYVAQKLLENNRDLIQTLMSTEEFLPLIYCAGFSDNMNKSFSPLLTLDESLFNKYYPDTAAQRSHFKEVIKYINKLDVDTKIPIYLNLMIQLHTEDDIFFKGTNFTFENDTDFAVPNNKTIELFKVATPYEYLQEFLKINLLDDTIRYINSGILDCSVESSIAMAVIESLKLNGFPNPFIFFDSEVTLVNGDEIHLGELILKNPKNYPFEPKNYYDLKYNEFTKEIIYAELG